MFKLMDEQNPLYENKICPKCGKECLQALGYDPTDDSREILHKCSNCGCITPYWDGLPQEKEGDHIS